MRRLLNAAHLGSVVTWSHLAQLVFFKPPLPAGSSTRKENLARDTVVKGTTLTSSAYRLSQSAVSTTAGLGFSWSGIETRTT